MDGESPDGDVGWFLQQVSLENERPEKVKKTSTRKSIFGDAVPIRPCGQISARSRLQLLAAL